MWVMDIMKRKIVPLGTIPKGIVGIESNFPGIDIPGYLKCNGFAIK